MTRVTEHFGITGTVEFLNVHLEIDNPLFVDPSAIRNHAATDVLAGRAHRLLVAYFGEVLQRRRSRESADHAVGRSLLANLHEPNETRLGTTRGRVCGHGFGPGMGERLWAQLGQNQACAAAALTRLEDIALFIDGVGDDLVSDLTTRVVFGVLHDFTSQMCERHPELRVELSVRPVELWEPSELRWVSHDLELPYVAGRQLLLVPKNWVFWRMLMDAEAFYNRFGTATVQRERTTLRRGRALVPSKRSLKAEFPHVKGLNNRQAARYKLGGVDLVAEYRARVDSAYEPMSDAEMDHRTAG